MEVTSRMTIARLILCGIARNRVRTVLLFSCALLLAALPLAVGLAVESGRARFQAVLDRLGADLLIVPEGAETRVETALLMGKPAQVWMPGDVVDKMSRLPGVARVSPQLHLATLEGASCCSASEMFIVAFDPATDFTVRPWQEPQTGADLPLGEVLGGSDVFVPPGWTNIVVYGTPVTLKGNLSRSGTGLDQAMFMTLETARELARLSAARAKRPLALPTNQVSAILVKLQPGTAPGRVVARVLREIPGVTALQSPELFRGTRREVSGLLKSIFLMAAAVWGLSVLITGLVFALAAHERRREMGVLRALGSSRRFVFGLLLAEANCIAAMGAVAGLAAVLILATVFRQGFARWLEAPFVFPALPMLMALVAAAFVLTVASVMIGALLPAWRLSRTEPALAMRD